MCYRPDSAASTAAPACFALIEWETANEEPNAYTVIESSQIVEVTRDPSRPLDEAGHHKRFPGLYTGKLIHVLRGRYIMPATIVMISESSPPSRTIAARFHRTVVDRTLKATPPMTFDQQTQTVGLPTEVPVSHDARYDRILSYLENVMAEQKSYRMENEYNRKLLHDMQEKILAQHEILQNLQRQTTTVESGTTVMVTAQMKENPSSSELIATEVIERYQLSGAEASTDEMILSEYESVNESSMVVKTSTVSDEQWSTVQVLDRFTDVQQDMNSKQSWASSSDVAAMDDLASNAKSNSQSSLFNGPHTEPCDPSLKTEKASHTTVAVEELIKNDWNDCSQDVDQKPNADSACLKAENDPSTTMVSIGSKNTLVRKSVLDKIKWANYKYATRKLLLQVFSREELATHSLSGRPSPAYAGNAEKPVKDRLDPNVVADVVEIVRKRCNVDESMVRSVITTKCADENKMLRQRMGTLVKKKPAIKREVEDGKGQPDGNDKENICTSAPMAL
uniref:BEN domain-containing protein n=1 Tax=Anopheles farauti TaxID=69004 RepID=A0A182QS85_9DIPT